jgi:hypothetical protein
VLENGGLIGRGPVNIVVIGKWSKDAAMPLADLGTRGWALVDGVSSREDLLELAKALGHPEPTPNGETVKEIRVTKANEARPGTQSALFGIGRFPLHTDTVFWPVPVRYVVLRAQGDTRRPTTVMAFEDLLQKCGSGARALVERSVWIAGTSSRRFYCSLRFRERGSIGWRYDGDFMSPFNDAARVLHEELRPLVSSAHAHSIRWSEDVALVVCNWTTLHGRGPRPDDEGTRVIERIYVR